MRRDVKFRTNHTVRYCSKGVHHRVSKVIIDLDEGPVVKQSSCEGFHPRRARRCLGVKQGHCDRSTCCGRDCQHSLKEVRGSWQKEAADFDKALTRDLEKTSAAVAQAKCDSRLMISYSLAPIMEDEPLWLEAELDTVSASGLVSQQSAPDLECCFTFPDLSGLCTEPSTPMSVVTTSSEWTFA